MILIVRGVVKRNMGMETLLCSYYVPAMALLTKLGWYRKEGLPHIDANGLLQHIVLRAADGVDLVASGAAGQFEQSLISNSQQAPVALAWCVMPDHAHLACYLVDTVRLGDAVRVLKARVSRSWRHSPMSAFGPGYFDRFCRDRAQADRLWRYIEWNPVDAGLVRAPSDWRWSSAWWKAHRQWNPDWSRLPIFPE